jgi:hypothetical protein
MLREMLSSSQAAAAAACAQAKQERGEVAREADARQQLAQQLELKAGQIASLMTEGGRWRSSDCFQSSFNCTLQVKRWPTKLARAGKKRRRAGQGQDVFGVFRNVY